MVASGYDALGDLDQEQVGGLVLRFARIAEKNTAGFDKQFSSLSRFVDQSLKFLQGATCVMRNASIDITLDTHLLELHELIREMRFEATAVVTFAEALSEIIKPAVRGEYASKLSDWNAWLDITANMGGGSQEKGARTTSLLEHIVRANRALKTL